MLISSASFSVSARTVSAPVQIALVKVKRSVHEPAAPPDLVKALTPPIRVAS
jgi:hypothetical protein